METIMNEEHIFDFEKIYGIEITTGTSQSV